MQMIGIQRGTFCCRERNVVYDTIMVVDSQDKAESYIRAIKNRLQELDTIYREYAEFDSDIEARVIQPIEDAWNSGKPLSFSYKNNNDYHKARIAHNEEYNERMMLAMQECDRLRVEWLTNLGCAKWEQHYIMFCSHQQADGEGSYYHYQTCTIVHDEDGIDFMSILGGSD